MCKYFFCLNVRFSYTNLKKKKPQCWVRKGQTKNVCFSYNKFEEKKNGRNVECQKGKPKEG